MGSNNSRSLSVYHFRLISFALLILIGATPLVGWAKEYSVTTTRDNVVGSLRSALVQAEEARESATITFDLSTEDRYYDHTEHTWTFFIESPLPVLRQKGTTIIGPAFEQSPHIILSGTQSSLDAESNGLIIDASNITIANIGITSFPRNGIVIQGHADRTEGVRLHNVIVQGSGHGERYGGRVLITDMTRSAGIMIDGAVKDVRITGSRVHDNHGSGIVIHGGEYASSTLITVHDTEITHNQGHGLWAKYVSDMVIDGAVRSNNATLLAHNRRLNASIIEGERITLRSLRIQNTETTDRDGNIVIAESSVVALEYMTMVGGSVSGVTFSNVGEGVLTNSVIADLYPHAVEQYGGLVRYQGNTFRDIEESAVFAGPLYGTEVPYATMHFSDNHFERVRFSVAQEYGCIASVADAQIPGRSLHVRPFLLRLDESTPITTQELFVSGAGLPPSTLMLIGGGYYGYEDTTISDVRSWMRAKGSDAPHGVLRVHTITEEGVVYEGAIEIALLDACTHDTRDNDTDELSGLPTPYTITLAPSGGDIGGSHVALVDTQGGTYDHIDAAEATTGIVVVEGTLELETKQTIYTILTFGIIMIVTLCLLSILFFVVRSTYILRTKSNAFVTMDGVRVTRRTHYISSLPRKRGIVRSFFDIVRDRALFFAIAQFIVSGLNYIFLILIARFGGAHALGEINALLVVLFLSAMPAVIMQDYTTYSVAGLCCTRAKRHIISRYMLYSGGIALLVLGVGLIASPSLMHMTGINTWSTMILFAGVAGLNYLLPVPRGAWQAHKNFYMLGAHLLVETIIKSGSVLFFLLFFDPVNAVLLAIAVGYVISLAWLGASLISRHFISLKRAFMPSQTKGLFLRSGIYFLGGIILFSILYNIDLLFVQHFARDEAGLYSVAARIAQLLVFGGLSISTVFLPTFRERQSDHPLSVLRRPYGFVVVGVVCFFAILFCCGNYVITVLFGPEFVDAYPLLLRTGFNMACLTLAAPGMYFLLARGDHAFLTIMLVIVCILVGSIMLFAPPLHMMIGMFGVANVFFLGTVVTSVVRAIHRYE